MGWKHSSSICQYPCQACHYQDPPAHTPLNPSLDENILLICQHPCQEWHTHSWNNSSGWLARMLMIWGGGELMCACKASCTSWHSCANIRLSTLFKFHPFLPHRYCIVWCISQLAVNIDIAQLHFQGWDWLPEIIVSNNTEVNMYIKILMLGTCNAIYRSIAGITLGMGTTNESRRCYVTPYLIGWAHTQNDPGITKAEMHFLINIYECLCRIRGISIFV